MSCCQSPTVDVQAPNGGRIVLTPKLQLDRVPQLGRGGLAVVVVLCGIFLATGLNRLNHTDLWGHMNFGRWIARNGQLPSADPFRSLVAGESFLNVPWLAQVLGHLWHEALGLEGLVAMHALLVTLAAAALIWAVKARNVPNHWAAAAAAAAFLLSAPIVGTIRPQLFGMLAFALTLFAISRLDASWRPLAWIGPVFALWANLHGSFPMGLVALACYATGRTWDTGRALASVRATARHAAVRRAWAALVVATAATCLNPLGIRLLTAVAGFADNSNLSGISEWQPLILKSLGGVLFFASLAITAILLRTSPRRITSTEILLAAVFGLASLAAMRMLVWWAFAWTWAIAPHAAAAWLVHRRSRSSLNDDEALRSAAGRKRLLIAAVIVFLTLWWSPSTFGLLMGRSRENLAVLSSGTPDRLADRINQLALDGRVFTPLDWADYLIWKSDARVEPMVYSHVHLTGGALWRDFMKIRAGSVDWLETADQQGLKYLVLDPRRNRRLAQLALASPRCELLNPDDENSRGLLIAIHE